MVAPSRSGKGVSTVIPTLLSWSGSVIVFDPKAENWHITAGFRSKFSHALRFSPVIKDSVHFNILAEVRPGENAVRDAEIIADILTAPQDDAAAKGENQQHFIDTAKNLLTGAILHVLASPEIRDKSLGGVLDFLSSSALDADGNEDFGAGICKKMIFGEHLGEVHSVIAAIGNQQLAGQIASDPAFFQPLSGRCRLSRIPSSEETPPKATSLSPISRILKTLSRFT